jgi:DNA mismatch endonuclease (patch repair protein)
VDRSENMRAIRSRDTRPELTVRSLVHRLGYRFRLHRKDLPGTPDLAFPSRKKVIFVNGCYWHSHRCKRGSVPATNRDFWVTKLQRNKSRDKANLKALRGLGWNALVIWQCQLKDIESVEGRVRSFLDPG